MHVQTYPQAAEFAALVQPFLEQDEIANNLILGATLRLQARGRSSRRHPPFLATAADGDRLVAAALMTPPRRLWLACPDADPIPLRLLAQVLQASKIAVPGVSAPTPVAEEMARQWQRLTGSRYELLMKQRLLVLHAVTPPTWPHGRFRPARMEDIDLLARWIHAFQSEALPHETADFQTAQLIAANLLQAGSLFLWDDKGPVSMAAQARPTRRGSAINLVYTPPEKRGQGYASACVAGLSQHILHNGFEFCTLFTDQTNPTSNHIYQAVGYRPVAEFSDLHFEPPSR